MSEIQGLIEERNAQVLAITDENREKGDDSNPILYAEQGPNRFALMSLFFTDTDGVQIQEDIEEREIAVKFFTDTEEIELTEGALYSWALDFYKNNY